MDYTYSLLIYIYILPILDIIQVFFQKDTILNFIQLGIEFMQRYITKT